MEIITPAQAKLISEHCKRPELEAWLLDKKLAYFAMHEAEKALSEFDFAAYFTHLIHETNTNTGEVVGHFELIHATAAQRSEAFLRTLGLWKDDK